MAFFRSFDQFESSHTLIFMSIHCLCLWNAHTHTHLNSIASLVTINSVILQNVIKNQRNYFFRLQTQTFRNTLTHSLRLFVFVLDFLCFVSFCLPEIVLNVRAANEYVTHSLSNLHTLLQIHTYGMWSATTACGRLHLNERASEISITYIGDGSYNHINRGVIDYLTRLSP